VRNLWLAAAWHQDWADEADANLRGSILLPSYIEDDVIGALHCIQSPICSPMAVQCACSWQYKKDTQPAIGALPCDWQLDGQSYTLGPLYVAVCYFGGLTCHKQ